MQILAASIGLVSMSSFVVLAYLSGEFAVEVNKVVVADIVGSIAAGLVSIIKTKEGRSEA